MVSKQSKESSGIRAWASELNPSKIEHFENPSADQSTKSMFHPIDSHIKHDHEGIYNYIHSVRAHI